MTVQIRFAAPISGGVIVSLFHTAPNILGKGSLNAFERQNPGQKKP